MSADELELLIVILGGIVVLSSLLGVFLYYTKKAVFFPNQEDMILTIAGFWLLPIVAWLAFQVVRNGGMAQEALFCVLGIWALGYLCYVFHRALADNQRSWLLALPVGISKVVFALCAVVAVVAVVAFAIAVVVGILDKVTGGKKNKT
jgi:hypothetical protein